MNVGSVRMKLIIKVLYNSGQLMIIFGTGTVNKVYDEFMALTGVKEISASEVKGAEADKKGKFFSVLKVFSVSYTHLDVYKRQVISRTFHDKF